MTRHRYNDTLPGDDLQLYSRYSGLRALHPVRNRAPARRPVPNDRRPRRASGPGRL